MGLELCLGRGAGQGSASLGRWGWGDWCLGEEGLPGCLQQQGLGAVCRHTQEALQATYASSYGSGGCSHPALMEGRLGDMVTPVTEMQCCVQL